MRVLLLLAILPLAACQSKWERESASGSVPPAGAATARTYAASGFTGVDLRGSDDVEVRIADAFSVRAEGDAETLDRLDIRVENGDLRIARKHQSGSWFHNGDGRAKIFVTMPRLASASVAGSGDLDIERAEGDFAGAVAGSGDLKVAAFAGGAVDLSVAGSGDVVIAGGSASRLKASIAGSGGIDTRGLTATSAAVSIAGSGGVRGTVKGEASVSIVGSGDVELGGGAKCTVDRMGSGNARCS